LRKKQLKSKPVLILAESQMEIIAGTIKIGVGVEIKIVTGKISI
jgi:hypothetical protein